MYFYLYIFDFELDFLGLLEYFKCDLIVSN